MKTKSSPKKSDAQSWPFVRFSESDKAWKVDARTKNKGGARRFFPTKSEAETFAAQCRILRGNQGSSAFGSAELDRYGKTVNDAVKFYLAHLRRAEKSVPVSVAIAAFKLTIQDHSERYRNDVRVRLAHFEKEFGTQQIGAIEPSAIREWLDALKVGAVTRNTMRSRISPVFALAMVRGWRADNPFTGGKLSKVSPAPEKKRRPKILAVDQVARLLESASDETLPFWAIAIFAGLRPESELWRLKWEHIDLAERVIVVDGDDAGGEKTKTGRRVVKISDNLAAWLAPYEGRTGNVVENRNIWVRHRVDKRKVGFGTPGTETDAERAAGIKLQPWVADYTRHTFGSYLLAKCGDVGVVSTQMGNSPEMVRTHYLSLVKPAAAAAFWQLAPLAAPGNVVAMA